ncbi:MAG: hypothetical protein GY758_29710 [Fuerstiella sp.]|nr:hypothetical protein [Fuerstiella sp.]MCP4512411.1 hypothetical protein [Fuerstiella sp.]
MTVRFQSEITPQVRQHCVACHRTKIQEGELNLAIPQRVRRDSKNGEVVILGAPERSRLRQLVFANQMPPHNPLPSCPRERLRRWILVGAPGLTPAAAGGVEFCLSYGKPGHVCGIMALCAHSCGRATGRKPAAGGV